MTFFRPQGGGRLHDFRLRGGFDCKAPDGKYSQASLVLMAFFGQSAEKLELDLKLSSLKNAIKSKNLGVWG